MIKDLQKIVEDLEYGDISKNEVVKAIEEVISQLIEEAYVS